MNILILLILMIFYPVLGWCESSVLWQSDMIDKPVLGIKIGAFTQKDTSQIALLSLKEITLYQINSGKLEKILDHPFAVAFEPVRINKFDFHEDGLDEMIVTGIQKGRVQSEIYGVNSGKWILLQELPYYINVISQGESRQIIGQKKFGNEDYSGTPFVIKGEIGNLKQGESLDLKKGLWTKNISLYSLDGFKSTATGPTYLVADQSGYLNVLESNQNGLSKIWGSGESYGGAVFHLDYDIRNVLNELEKTHFEIPVRFVFDAGTSKNDFRKTLPVTQPICDERDHYWHPPCIYYAETYLPDFQGSIVNDVVYVIKNTQYLKNVTGAVPSVKNAQMVALKWNGHSLQEVWNSARFDGGISDFDLIQWDNDKTPEIIAVNVLRGKGYWETQTGFKSQLMVLDPKVE